MPASKPVIYLFYGEDEFAISQALKTLEDKVGDPVAASMNITRLDGKTFNCDRLLETTNPAPFLAERRLVVLNNPTAGLKSQEAQEKFLRQLEKIPNSTGLALVENRKLTDERDRKNSKIHWLEKWARSGGERVYVKEFELLKGEAVNQWVRERVNALGGKMTPQAVGKLVQLVEGDKRLADLEIQKLLDYVDYKRPIEAEDVELLTADYGAGDIWKLVDSLGMKNGKLAMEMLQRLLEEQDPLQIFGMIVRQFRLLLLVREVLDGGGTMDMVMKQFRVSSYQVDRLIPQARKFALPELENVMRRLLVLDEAVKTGGMPAELVLETFVAAFSVA